MSAFRHIVEARLPVTPVPGLSSLRLHLANETSGLGRLLAELGSESAPYWGHVWAGGLALARHIEAEPDSVRDRSVIDYGTGSGLVAIAAAKAGARQVLARDIDPLALEAASLNAALNGVEIVTRLIERGSENALASDSTGPLLVLAGDVFYDAGTADRALANLKALSESGADILIGDPFRTHLPERQLSLIARYDVAEFASAGKPVAAGVFRLRRA